MNRMGWVVAAVLAAVLLLMFAWRADEPKRASAHTFDPSTAVLTTPPPAPAAPADTERRVSPPDDTAQVERAVHEEAERTRRDQDAHDTYPAIYKR